MKILRIKLTQNQANYRKEETSTNKMTYPLPPFSTVIGALHKACAYTEYHPMQISIQGSFGAMQKEPYLNHLFFNSRQNDRGILVKLNNPDMYNSGFTKVAESIKPQGNDFEKEVTIRVLNRAFLDEFKDLKSQDRALEAEKKADNRVDDLKKKIKELKADLKKLDKGSDEYKTLKCSIDEDTKEQKTIENSYKSRQADIDKELDNFVSLVTSVKYYEVLYEVELTIHIKADESTIDDIQNNILNLKSIGRSEDFVDIIECKEVELIQEIDDEIICYDSAYIAVNNIKNENIVPVDEGFATKYYLNKDYIIENNKRTFNKQWVMYANKFSVDSETVFSEETGIYVDQDKYIINFI